MSARGHLDTTLGHLGAILGPSRGHLGAILAIVGLCCAILGPFRDYLGAVLGPSWALLGVTLRGAGAMRSNMRKHQSSLDKSFSFEGAEVQDTGKIGC
jgi:hypothetical protein